jgi:hypothetical protein
MSIFPNDFTETLTIEGQLFGERARELLGLETSK